MNVRSFTYEGFEQGQFGGIGLVEVAAIGHPANIIAEPAKALAEFTAEDLEIAKTVAKADGIKEGFDQARAELLEEKAKAEVEQSTKTLEVLEKINLQLADLQMESDGSRQKFSDKLGALALSIAQKVCADISDKVIEAEISKIIKESIGKLEKDDKIKLHLNAKNAEALNTKFTGVAINVDEAMEHGDFRIEWQNGFAERDVKKLWKVIGEICSRHSELEENEIITESNLNNNNEDKNGGQ